MATRIPKTEASTEQLKADLEHLTQTVEELVSATADDTRSNIKDLRARAEARGEELYNDVSENVRHQADVCDEYVHQNPWTSVGVGAAVGVVFGLLLGRR